MLRLHRDQVRDADAGGHYHIVWCVCNDAIHVVTFYSAILRRSNLGMDLGWNHLIKLNLLPSIYLRQMVQKRRG